MSTRRSWWRAIAALILLMAAFMYWPLTTYADVGDGSGGGGGPAVPLYMDWSYPRDGETHISVNPIIQCKFSHNVAHFEVRKRNKTLFSLTKEDGTDVPIRAYTADVQIEFDKRQYIYLSPINSLEENTTYFVSVKEGVQAKNGMATEKEQHFSFVTGSKNVSVPLLIDNENKASGADDKPPGEQVIESAHKIEISNDSIPSEDVMDDKQVEPEAEVQKLRPEPEVQQSEVSPMPAQTEEAAQPEVDIKPQTATQTQMQTQIQSTQITSLITWILVAAILILAVIVSTALRIKWGGSPKLP